ncbi:alpha/beta fold hydrolase [Salinarimonas rosea]|uniref:alpha/beta fold hydrolase n=1 Tax=Salinarimonas rosea TaxID=552063 RepID=UPI000411783D|nr:alpha/beta hydrolase [Salinarimonas rosea]
MIRYGGNIHEEPQSVLAAALEIARCRHYGWGDVLRILKSPFYALERLIDELYCVRLDEEAHRLPVPVLLLEGRHDWTAPSVLARSWYKALDAPCGKDFVWFEHSAHFPFVEEPGRFDDALDRFYSRSASPGWPEIGSSGSPMEASPAREVMR